MKYFRNMNCIAIFFALASTPANSNEHRVEIIKIHNVCIELEKSAEYNVRSIADFKIITINRIGTVTNVYVGYNPNLVGDNRKFTSRLFLKSQKKPMVVNLTGTQFGQMLGVPKRAHDRYFHIYSAAVEGPVDQNVVHLVGFC